MAVCLDYQAVYARRKASAGVFRTHLLASMVLMIAFTTRVWVKLESTEAGYRLARERQVTVELDMRRRELELKRSVLLRPDNLARAARETLGLVPRTPNQVRKLQY